MQVKSTRLLEITWKQEARRHVTDCGSDWNITRKWVREEKQMSQKPTTNKWNKALTIMMMTRKNTAVMHLITFSGQIKQKPGPIYLLCIVILKQSNHMQQLIKAVVHLQKFPATRSCSPARDCHLFNEIIISSYNNLEPQWHLHAANNVGTESQGST